MAVIPTPRRNLVCVCKRLKCSIFNQFASFGQRSMHFDNVPTVFRRDLSRINFDCTIFLQPKNLKVQSPMIR